ncbi:MAG: hypothetical protein GY885_09045 [Phycisphaeraceae bacterium]|nr:hypothetical protein [Phycisphaeraceae bacterium]
MSREGTGISGRARLQAMAASVRRRGSRLIRFGSRRSTITSGLVLVIPVVALAQPLGLLLWARLRLLTTIPRTAMATEEPTRIAADPGVVAFPDLPDPGLDDVFRRDPMQVSPHHFPRSTFNPVEPGVGPKTDVSSAEEEGHEARLVRERLVSIVSDVRVQGLISDRGIALIDGRACRVGDEIPVGAEGVEIRLLEVRNGSVVIEIDECEFVLQLIAGGNGSVDIRPQDEEFKQ